MVLKMKHDYYSKTMVNLWVVRSMVLVQNKPKTMVTIVKTW